MVHLFRHFVKGSFVFRDQILHSLRFLLILAIFFFNAIVSVEKLGLVMTASSRVCKKDAVEFLFSLREVNKYKT